MHFGSADHDSFSSCKGCNTTAYTVVVNNVYQTHHIALLHQTQVLLKLLHCICDAVRHATLCNPHMTDEAICLLAARPIPVMTVRHIIIRPAAKQSTLSLALTLDTYIWLCCNRIDLLFLTGLLMYWTNQSVFEVGIMGLGIAGQRFFAGLYSLAIRDTEQIWDNSACCYLWHRHGFLFINIYYSMLPRCCCQTNAMWYVADTVKLTQYDVIKLRSSTVEVNTQW